MPLDFTGIYKLSDVNQNYVKTPQIAMAPKKVKVKDSHTGKTFEQYQFLVPNECSLGHTISGKVHADSDHSFEIEDHQRKSDDGKPIIWRFEPLTLKLWNEMGENGDVASWEKMKDDIKSDDDLLHFYKYEWLLPRMEWWAEDTGTSGSSEKPSVPEVPKPTE